MLPLRTLSLALLASSTTLAHPNTASPSTERTLRTTSPIPVEVFVGNNGLGLQLIISKSLIPESRFGIFNVTSFFSDYEATAQKTQSLMQSLITVDLWGGFAVNAGAAVNHVTGLRPTAGLQYVYSSRELLIVALPRFDLTPTYNFEALAIVEYKPRFTDNWGLYTRVQGLFNYNTRQVTHERSYLWLRLGASYQGYQFGLAGNFDWYGPAPKNENGFGVFGRVELF
jgi:hypothetical protein